MMIKIRKKRKKRKTKKRKKLNKVILNFKGSIKIRRFSKNKNYEYKN
jgi:hypothetical protein